MFYLSYIDVLVSSTMHVADFKFLKCQINTKIKKSNQKNGNIAPLQSLNILYLMEFNKL